jgi:uncharacterized membrane protein YqaE (UPF0057 family)
MVLFAQRVSRLPMMSRICNSFIFALASCKSALMICTVRGPRSSSNTNSTEQGSSQLSPRSYRGGSGRAGMSKGIFRRRDRRREWRLRRAARGHPRADQSRPHLQGQEHRCRRPLRQSLNLSRRLHHTPVILGILPSAEGPTMLCLLAVLCPPATVLLLGKPSQAAVNLGLTLLLYFPGLLHALYVVRQYKIQQRNEILTRLVSRYYSRPSQGRPGWGLWVPATPSPSTSRPRS